ncbi:conserved hypothetical protein [Culex quinquefasciatus]|uniref:Uncharacterized protein n=1 Tax=Culex quinquefasciatus TaxID=7176 RepID=B0WR93_CULQU|nr:conserved hypothetical protein [Culex quinquefasciatus]|eukprot:XP_001851227.1 conserved hypothetical protein [Culex quinquefasciatus]
MFELLAVWTWWKELFHQESLCNLRSKRRRGTNQIVAKHHQHTRTWIFLLWRHQEQDLFEWSQICSHCR